MKLARRLTLFLMLGITLVLAGYAGLTMTREVHLFETDMIRDHDVLGKALAGKAASVWDRYGLDEAIETVRVTNDRADFRVRWRSADERRPGQRGALPFFPVGGGDQIHRYVAGNGASELVSFYPVRHQGSVEAWIEISESLKSRDSYIRTSAITALGTTAVIALISTVLAGFLGLTLVGRPVQTLVQQARRVGRGDLSERVSLGGRDEMGELGRELNAMCDRLEEANDRVASETAARITALEQLRHADRLMTVGKLASGVAHELGTPLNVVSGRAKMLERGQVQAQGVQENARIIGEQAERIATIVRQLLDFARARGPKTDTTDLALLARSTVTLLSPLAAKRSVELVVEPADQTPEVHVDPGQMQQVLTNLIVNGIQATYEPGIVRVEIAERRAKPPEDIGGGEGDFVCLSVSDCGHGMAKETIAHVFEPFFTTKEVGEGTGLGLSVAYGIVREHGGFIEVDSALGAGSRFSVFLPKGAPS